MADQPKAQPEAEKAETQPASMPDAEQQTTAPEPTKEASPDVTSGDSPKEGEAAGAELPEGMRERTTEQFEKLRNQLAEERSRRIKAENVFTQIKPQEPSPEAQPTTPSAPDYYNPDTGEVDVNKLEQHNAQLRSQVAQLGQQVKGIADASQVAQEKEAFEAYPDLDPQNKGFNQEFHNAVSGYLTNVLFKGDSITFKEAADKVAGLSQKEVKKAEKAGADKALESLTPKEQAALEATGRSDRGKPSAEALEDLQRRTREGDDMAVYERLKGVPSS